MPLAEKIQPINARDAGEPPIRIPVVRSRLKSLLRISTSDKPVITSVAETFFTLAPILPVVEPSSVNLAKMVQNFIEERNEKPAQNRCNCFNGNRSDGSDTEPDSVSASDLLKGLVICTNIRERNILVDTVKIIERTGKSRLII